MQEGSGSHGLCLDFSHTCLNGTCTSCQLLHLLVPLNQIAGRLVTDHARSAHDVGGPSELVELDQAGRLNSQKHSLLMGWLTLTAAGIPACLYINA